MLAAAHHDTRQRADAAAATAVQATNLSRALVATSGDVDQRLQRLEREAAIRAVTAWVRHADVAPSLRVSIVLPTRDRAHLLRRAIASVEAQVYERWELVIVDDGSIDGTPALLAGITEARVRVARADGVGAAAARNVALAHATGDVIAYLDDDNTLDPLWCKAVVWAFQQRPDVDVLYGARVMDDLDRIIKVGRGALPTIHFLPYHRESLEAGNMADMGVIAHRAGHPEAYFDPELVTHADWDLFLRLTERNAPLELPVIACYYTSDTPGRLSDLDRDDSGLVLQKQAARRAATVAAST